MRKVYLNVMFKIIVWAEEDIEISNVMDELDYDFVSTVDNASVMDMEMVDYEITDSK